MAVTTTERTTTDRTATGNGSPPGRPRTSVAQTSRSRRTRHDLVEAVRADLRETGTFTAETVAARAECSAATFYAHFGTKDAALTEAFTLVLEDLTALSAESLSAERFGRFGCEQTVSEFVAAQTQFFATESLAFRAAIERLPSHRPIRDAYRNAERVWMAQLVPTLADLVGAGLIDIQDIETAAEALLVFGEGLNNPRLLRPDGDELRAVMAETMLAILKPTPTPPPPVSTKPTADT